MRRTAALVQAAFLSLTLVLVTPPRVRAQRTSQSGKSATDPRLQELIDARKDERWDFYKTQLEITQPPRSQPLRALPEWHPAGGVILTLDTDYLNSFKLNRLLKTEGRGAEILRREPAAMRYVAAATCNAMYGAQMAASEPVRRNAEVTAFINSFCGVVPVSERTATAMAGASPEEAESWLRFLFGVLEGDALPGVSDEGSLLTEISHAHTFLQIVKSFVPHTKVLILLQGQGQNEDSLYRGIAIIKNFPGGREVLNSKNVQFVQIGISSKWVRDYGPIFIRGADGQLFCVDPRYETNRTSLEEKRRGAEQRRQFELLKRLVQSMNNNNLEAGKTELADAEDPPDNRDRLFDDVSPSLLAARLRQRSGNVLRPYPLNVVRPPIALDGGDFFTDGNGIGFTSTATLQLNGGNQEQLNQVFREYFGVKDVVYLNPLPGLTVKHIDMFFKVVSPEIILLGRFEDIGHDSQGAALQAEARRVLSYNLTVLKNFYEGRRVKVNVVRSETDALQKKAVNIVLIPMPNLRRPAREGIATLDREWDALDRRYQQHAKGADDALRWGNALSNSLASLRQSVNVVGNAADRLKNSSSAKSVELAALKETASRAAAAVRSLFEEYGAEAKTFDWQGSYQRILDLSTYLNTRRVATGRDLKSQERRELASYLHAAADALRAVAAGLQPVSARSLETYKRHMAAQESLVADRQLISWKRRLLEERFQYRLDVYLTYLNSLQLRTGRANLLFVPTYSATGAIEKQALGILSRVYRHAYGNVTIIPVNSDYIIRQSGSIHCLAQALPAEVDIFADDWNFRSKLNAK